MRSLRKIFAQDEMLPISSCERTPSDSSMRYRRAACILCGLALVAVLCISQAGSNRNDTPSFLQWIGSSYNNREQALRMNDADVQDVSPVERAIKAGIHAIIAGSRPAMDPGSTYSSSPASEYGELFPAYHTKLVTADPSTFSGAVASGEVATA